ncbi:MAG: restriction endonuclease subunit S [Gelidibacter sp.]
MSIINTEIKSEKSRESHKSTVQTYAHYKDSGVEWLGEIPEHWEVRKLRFEFNLGKGLTITKQNLINEGILCVNYGEIHSKYGFELDTTKHILKCVDEEYLSTDPKSLIKKGEFVFADTSEDIEGSGNFTHLRSDNDIFAGYHTVIARPKNEIISLFFAFVFDSLSFRNQIRTRMKGVKVYSITQSILKETTVWFPSLKEQTAIANFLDDKTTKIDQAIAIKQQQIALLKERQQILIHKAVTRGLDDTVALKDSGVEWIGEIPEHWEVKALKFISNLQSGEFISAEDFKEEGYPVYGGNGFRAYAETYTNEGFYALIGRQGALCGNVNYAEGKFYATEHAVVVYPINNEDTLWLGEAIKVADFNRLSQSAAQPGIAVGVIKNERFPYPPLQEQNQISKYIESASQKIDTAIAIKQQEIEKLKEYKSSLINSVVTGKVRVC